MAKGAPISIRLTPSAEQLVEHEARRLRRSRSAVLQELAEEGAKARLFPGLAFRGPEPRRPWLIGTGLDVWEIVQLHRDHGGDVEAMLAAHPLLSERAIKVALAYARRFPDEIEEAITENRRPVEEWLELLPGATA
jgi:uncharacterized protein (DUF433 family)